MPDGMTIVIGARTAVGRPRTVSDDVIIAAAIQAIERHGPARLTLAHVAGDVGLSPATLVQRFGSKHGLLVAIAERAPGELAATFATARTSATSSVAALCQALIAPWSHVTSPAALANHLAFLQLDITDPELRQHTTEHARVMRNEIGAVLDVAVEQGELVIDDREQLVELVMATVSGALVTWAFDGHGCVTDWLAARLTFLLARFRPSQAR